MAVATTYPITLTTNLIYKSLSNMLLSQEVFGDNIKDTKASLLGLFRKGVGLYGDQAVYYSTDVLAVRDWLNDAEAANLLNLYRAQSPKVQTVTINQYKKICLTLDQYLSKQAWMNEGAFSQFDSIMTGWITDTKRILESSLVNVFVGTHVTTEADQVLEIDLPAEPADGASEADIEAYNRICAETIAMEMAGQIVALEYPNRNNDYGHMRSFSSDDFIAVWNADVVNKITRVDTPTIYHRDSALADKFGEYTLPPFLFGDINTTAGTAPASNASIYYAVPVTVEANSTTGTPARTYFPGELVPAGTAYDANTTYTVNPNIAFKLIHKKGVVLLDAFSTTSEFYNSASLTTTMFNIFGYSPVTQLHNYPFITAKLKVAASA